jgi:hypothetical protein
MRFKPSVAFAYLLLLLISFGVPVLHHNLADRAIEHSRMGTGFLASHILFWRWAGQIAWIFPIAIAASFVLSLRHERFTRTATLFGVATVQLIFITVYGVYCAFLLSHLLLGRVA